jgi:hypothetical protein
MKRDTTDATHKLNGIKKRKDDAEGFLKSRTTEIATLKKRDQEAQQNIANIKQVLHHPPG